MPRIDFYIISASNLDAIRLFICRLVEKAHEAQKRILIWVDDEASAQQMSDRLWTFKDISFLPHRFAKEADESTPIVIDWQDQPTASDVFINASSRTPSNPNLFERIIEIAPEEPNWKESARTHYRVYKEQNFEITNHQLKK